MSYFLYSGGLTFMTETACSACRAHVLLAVTICCVTKTAAEKGPSR